MQYIFLYCIIISFGFSNCLLPSFQDYSNQRDQFVELEQHRSINQAWNLTENEKVVDALLQKFKNNEMQKQPVPVQLPFSLMREEIDQSELLTILKRMPKGSLLHSHDQSIQDMSIFIQATYLPGCMFNTDVQNYGVISFRPNSESFVPIESVRSKYPGGAAKFDSDLYKNVTILPEMNVLDETGDTIWQYFQDIFGRTIDVFLYLPVFKKFYSQVFSKYLNDGVYHFEIRISPHGLYDTGRNYTEAECINFILEELSLWKSESYDERSKFTVSFIYQVMRFGSVEDVSNSLRLAHELRALIPEMVGFDLVGHEDQGQSLLYWIPTFIQIENDILTKNTSETPMKFFFHAGESNRKNIQVNLIDAVLFNTSRIGHGFGILEFPDLWPLLRQKSILIEACPISNQLLGLLQDGRNHPIGELLRRFSKTNANGMLDLNLANLFVLEPLLEEKLKGRLNLLSSTWLSVSINNDDPGLWGIDALVSYDWYVATISWDLNLSGVKQLAFDSILHSYLAPNLKVKLMNDWLLAWDNWINDLAFSFHK